MTIPWRYVKRAAVTALLVVTAYTFGVIVRVALLA